jgi:hypothetical protein
VLVLHQGPCPASGRSTGWREVVSQVTNRSSTRPRVKVASHSASPHWTTTAACSASRASNPTAWTDRAHWSTRCRFPCPSPFAGLRLETWSRPGSPRSRKGWWCGHATAGARRRRDRHGRRGDRDSQLPVNNAAFTGSTTNPGSSFTAAANVTEGPLYGWGDDNTTANLGLENTPAPGPARRRWHGHLGRRQQVGRVRDMRRDQV